MSIVVVVRNEQQSLPALIDSLRAQTCRDFELLFVDDDSTDATAAVLARAQAQDARVRLVQCEPTFSRLNPKHAALARASSVARAPLVMFTDGDCVVPPTWVATALGAFSEPRLGLVFGLTRVAKEAGLLGAYQAFDHPIIAQYSAGSAGVGLPTGCFGHNMAVRRSVLEEVGGFAGLGYTLTEDSALVAAVRARGHGVRALSSTRMTIVTRPARSWRGLYHQRLRWMSGILRVGSATTRASLAVLMSLCILGVICLPLGWLEPALWTIPAALLGGLLLVAFVHGVTSRVDIGWWLGSIPFAATMVVQQAAMTCLALLGTSVRWKGRVLATRPPRAR